MQKRVSILLACLATVASGQFGAEVTMPPNTHQTGLFPFANNCPTLQTYKISAPASDEWLRLEPSTVEVGPGTSFAVRVNVNSTGRKHGAYGSRLSILCATCAASDPPCLQDTKDFPIRMTVASVMTPSEFTPIGVTDVPLLSEPEPPTIPPPVIPFDPPQRQRFGLLPWFAITFLVIGLIGAVFALWGLFGGSGRHSHGRLTAAESQRHRVRR